MNYEGLSLSKFYQESYVKIIATSLAIFIGVVFTIRLVLKRRRSKYPKDVVILHQPVSRGLRTPNASPFALKLETWLRMTKIPYQNEFGLGFSSKNQTPYITYNDLDVADSQFSIEFLSKTLNIDLNKNLTKTQKAIARTLLILIDGSLRWVYVSHIFIYQPNPKESGNSWPIIFYMRRKYVKYTYGQGYGRHTKEEVYGQGKADLTAINDIIGENKFIFGNEACDIDASVFGLIAQIMYHTKGPLNEHLIKSCPNVVRFIENMKNSYWPDWNSNIREKAARK